MIEILSFIKPNVPQAFCSCHSNQVTDNVASFTEYFTLRLYHCRQLGWFWLLGFFLVCFLRCFGFFFSTSTIFIQCCLLRCYTFSKKKKTNHNSYGRDKKNLHRGNLLKLECEDLVRSCGNFSCQLRKMVLCPSQKHTFLYCLAFWEAGHSCSL